MSLPFPFDLPSETRDARSGTVLMDSLADTTHAIYVESGRVALGRLQGGQLTHTVGVVQGPMWLNAGAAVLGLRPLATALRAAAGFSRQLAGPARPGARGAA